jgi:propanol-preferring alcohol dehydrogenase
MAGALEKLDSVLGQGDTVVISGSGGGLGHIGVQIASRVKNFRVIAVDNGEKKRELSLASGAEVFIDYQREDVASRVRELTGGEGAHATIVVPGTREAFAMAPMVVRNMGLIVCVGLPRNEMDLPISATACAARGVFFCLPMLYLPNNNNLTLGYHRTKNGQLGISIIGSSVGTEEQMAEVLQLAAAGVITPSIQTFDFSHTPALVHGLKDDAVVGRMVVRIPQ